MTGLLTGHSHLKGPHFKMELTDNPVFEICPEKDESAIHTYPMRV
jgi:hypothetical protein